MRFYIGLGSTAYVWAFERSMLSINMLWNNYRPFRINKWLLDSGGYTQITKYGKYIMTPKWYAWRINRLKKNGVLVGAFVQDWQCHPSHLAITGLRKEDHQERTVQSYVDLQPLTKVRMIPVLQGYHARDYVAHVKMYGDLLEPNAWVAVGGIAARQTQPGLILKILEAVLSERGDLRLHGFGLKFFSLQYESIVKLLYTADSINWSMSARWRERSVWLNYGFHPNENGDPRLALKFAFKMQNLKGVENIVYGIKNPLQRTGMSLDQGESSRSVPGNNNYPRVRSPRPDLRSGEFRGVSVNS